MPSSSSATGESSPEQAALLASLVCRVPGALAALLVDPHGAPLARSHGALSDLEAAAGQLQALLGRLTTAAEHLDQGPLREVLLEAERRTLALLPLRRGCSLLLLLRETAPPGQALFEARRASAALNRAL